MAGRQGPADLRQMLAADQKRREKRQRRGRQQPAGEEGWHAGKDGEGRYASAAPSQTASSDGPLHREAAGEAAVEVEKAAATAQQGLTAVLDTCLDFVSDGKEDRASVEDAVETYGNTIMLEVQTRLRELQALWAFKRTQKKRSTDAKILAAMDAVRAARDNERDEAKRTRSDLQQTTSVQIAENLTEQKEAVRAHVSAKDRAAWHDLGAFPMLRGEVSMLEQRRDERLERLAALKQSLAEKFEAQQVTQSQEREAAQGKLTQLRAEDESHGGAKTRRLMKLNSILAIEEARLAELKRRLAAQREQNAADEARAKALAVRAQASAAQRLRSEMDAMEEWKARHTASLAELEGHGSAAAEATQLLGQLQQSSATAMAEIVSAGRPAARAEAPTAALPFGGALGGATGLAQLLGGGGATSGSNAGAGTGAHSAQGGLSEATHAGENNTHTPMDSGGRDGASGRGSRGSVGTGLPADSGAEKRERAHPGDELAMHDGADTIVFQSPLAAGRSGGDASAPDVSAASAAADALSKSQAKAARSKERRKQARGDWAAHQRRSTGKRSEDGPDSPSGVGGARSGPRRRPSDTDERASPSAMRRGHHLQATASRDYGDGVSLLPVCRVESSPELRGTYRARSSPQPPPPSPAPRGRTSSTPAGALRTPLCSSPFELCLT